MRSFCAKPPRDVPAWVPNAALSTFSSRQDLLRGRACGGLVRAGGVHGRRTGWPAHARATVGRRAHARACARVGTGHLPFPALSEPGLFRTAFAVPDQVENDPDPAKAGHGRISDPFQLLSAALDRMVEAAGICQPKRRPGAEYLAWSAVHGLAVLPRRSLARKGRPERSGDAGAWRLLDMSGAGTSGRWLRPPPEERCHDGGDRRGSVRNQEVVPWFVGAPAGWVHAQILFR
ncbi:TetR-like C-terminal domain-containing protein [Cupriavidus basilensis]